eukprot:TRINITY_DN10321_c0_g1_i2.p1 TRINITY_DN10321_c0_g1~~TRINITY_DN10321_c0_g1_i2.p1  ORF type:complete len:614 (+),score=131.55 TRINITY_DN10321_c0_g1_i2:736-2577(+)
MACGKEGPMVHSGAIIAAGITQGKSATLPWLKTPFLVDFRNDTEKRDFVASGAAAGVAAAFGAPIGGVLFSLEEGASFWNQQLTWRSFFCAMVSSFTLNFFKSGVSSAGWGALSFPGLLNFSGWGSGMPAYTLEYWLGFVFLGFFGGLIGALFCHINTRITWIRQRYVTTPTRVVLEALVCAFISATAAIVLSFNVYSCMKHLPEDEESLLDLIRFQCPQGYYNDMASLFLTSNELAIRRLFHYDVGTFTLPTLAIYFLSYFILAVVTYGVGIPSGLFVPALLCGASYGRFFGQIFTLIFPSWNLKPGIFALIGAASMLGGVVRMTISLCVILIEATGEVSYGLPIMVTLLLSKFTGDFFTKGLYDIHIHLKQVPILDWEGPLVMRKFVSQHVMATPVVCFSKIESVRKIVQTLRSTTHNGFPVVNAVGQVRGLILRSQLITLLKKKPFQLTPQKRKRYYSKVSSEDFKTDYPRFPSIDTVSITESELVKYMDLSHFMHITPHTVHYKATLLRVFQIFRTMGLRHLLVVKGNNKLVGIITRKDLVHAEDSLLKKKQDHGGNLSVVSLRDSDNDDGIEDVSISPEGTVLQTISTPSSNRETVEFIDSSGTVQNI